MIKRIMFVGLFIIFLLLNACASIIKEVPVKQSEYNDIKEAEKILITTKDNSQHIVIQHNFTEISLVGNELMSSKVFKPFEAHLSDICSVKINSVRDNVGKIITYEEIKRNIKTNKRVSNALIYAIGLGVFGLLPSGAMAIHEYEGRREKNHPGLFFVTEGVFIISGGYLGYKAGEMADIKKAIKQIERKRLNKR